MPKVEVKYNAEEFVNANFGSGVASAREYVKKYPKDSYGVDDFAEVHRMHEAALRTRAYEARGDGWINTRGWKEDDISFDMAVKAYESEV